MIFYFKKENRFYVLELTRDLFGRSCIVKTWGSLKTNWERKAEIPVGENEDPKDLILKLVSKRKARGYKLIQT